MNIYQDILLAKKTGKQLMAVLIDPEKTSIEQLPTLVKLIHQSIATHIFVGGSTDQYNTIEPVIVALKKATMLPIIIFIIVAGGISIYIMSQATPGATPLQDTIKKIRDVRSQMKAYTALQGDKCPKEIKQLCDSIYKQFTAIEEKCRRQKRMA